MPVRKLSDEELSRALSENAIGRLAAGNGEGSTVCLYQAADALGGSMFRTGYDSSGTCGWRLFDIEWERCELSGRTSAEDLLEVCRKIGAM